MTPNPDIATSPAGAANPDPAGFGVYVHWPFCASKCPYCDFNSHVRHGGVDEPAYLDAYLDEIRTTRREIGPRTVSSVFFGGGTPSLMNARTVAAIIDAIAGAWSLPGDAEITLEANPSSVEADRFAAYRQAGVNRVSLGVQSLFDDALQALGRLHTAVEARHAIDIAGSTFERHSFDLIYARPGQTAAAWEQELTQAIAIGTRHLSLYQLTIEAGTPFADLYDKGRLAIPPPQIADDLFGLTRAITAAHRLDAYETSNHAAPGEESRHNLLYWRYGEYAGIGPGAHARLIVDGARTATSTELLPERWLQRVADAGSGVVERERLSRLEMADELLMMSLRLAEGVDLQRLATIGGVRPGDSALPDLIESGHIALDPSTHRLRTTRAGSFVLNEVVRQLSGDFEEI
ncbi:MAG: radical SAM family heme chaperone HemW [Hyphomicrobiaceae bacterium]